MANVGEPASVLYSPALAEMIGCVALSDTPRVRGSIRVTFRDERGTLVTIRLMCAAAEGLLKALQSGLLTLQTEKRPNHFGGNLIEVQPGAVLEAPSARMRSTSVAGSLNTDRSHPVVRTGR